MDDFDKFLFPMAIRLSFIRQCFFSQKKIKTHSIIGQKKNEEICTFVLHTKKTENVKKEEEKKLLRCTL
jgi:hypothetical protein